MIHFAYRSEKIVSASSPPTFHFKRGDAFFLGMKALNELGTPASLADTTVRSQVRTPRDAMVAELEVVWVDRNQGTYELRAPGNGLIDTWPVDTLSVDVQYTGLPTGIRENVSSSETFFIQVHKEITR